MPITTDYRGFTITFDEFNESWGCQISSTSRYFEKQSLADVKKKIDAFIKAESDFKNVEAIDLCVSWRDQPFGATVTITSVCENGDVWITSSKGRNKVGKAGRHKLAKLTDENKMKVQQIAAIEAQIKELTEQIKHITASMERIFPEDTTSVAGV